jgi:hypothetical protein
MLDRPLDETEKILISHAAYDNLITPLHERHDTCQEEDVAILFKREDTDLLGSPLNELYAAVVNS